MMSALLTCPRLAAYVPINCCFSLAHQPVEIATLNEVVVVAMLHRGMTSGEAGDFQSGAHSGVPVCCGPPKLFGSSDIARLDPRTSDFSGYSEFLVSTPIVPSRRNRLGSISVLPCYGTIA